MFAGKPSYTDKNHGKCSATSSRFVASVQRMYFEVGWFAFHVACQVLWCPLSSAVFHDWCNILGMPRASVPLVIPYGQCVPQFHVCSAWHGRVLLIRCKGWDTILRGGVLARGHGKTLPQPLTLIGLVSAFLALIARFRQESLELRPQRYPKSICRIGFHACTSSPNMLSCSHICTVTLLRGGVNSVLMSQRTRAKASMH